MQVILVIYLSKKNGMPSKGNGMPSKGNGMPSTPRQETGSYMANSLPVNKRS